MFVYSSAELLLLLLNTLQWIVASKKKLKKEV